jgi:rubrerythrin
MGRLLTVHPCPVCNYHVEGVLHEGGSGIASTFLRNHYALAICQDCRHLVSVLVPNTDQEMQDALKAARYNIVQMEADAVIGDHRARDLLPLFRQALDSFDEGGETAAPVTLTACTVCGSANVVIQTGVSGEQFDQKDAWIQCPRCAEGRLLIETSGAWD